MKKENRAMLEMLVCASLWSIAGIFIKLIPWNSFVISALRSFFAGLTVLAYIRIKGYRISINRRTIVAGLLLGLVYIAFVAANKLTTAANAIVLQFTDPIFIVIFSALFFGQRFKKRDFIAVIFTFIGIAMFFLDQLEGGYLIGNFVAIFAGACLGGMFIAMGKADTEERFSAMLIGQATAFIFGLPFIITTKPEISALPVLYIVILGVLQLGIPYILYGRASEYCPPLCMQPSRRRRAAFESALGADIRRRKAGLFALIGGVIVIVSVTVWCIAGSKDSEAADAREAT